MHPGVNSSTRSQSSRVVRSALDQGRQPPRSMKGCNEDPRACRVRAAADAIRTGRVARRHRSTPDGSGHRSGSWARTVRQGSSAAALDPHLDRLAWQEWQPAPPIEWFCRCPWGRQSRRVLRAAVQRFAGPSVVPIWRCLRHGAGKWIVRRPKGGRVRRTGSRGCPRPSIRVRAGGRNGLSAGGRSTAATVRERS